MAKKDLATQQQSGTPAIPSDGKTLAAPAAGGGALVEGRDSSSAISRLAIYHDTPQEKLLYKGRPFTWGNFIDPLEGRDLGPTVRIIPIAGWMSWAKFIKGQTAPVYSFTDKTKVPKGDLEWTDVATGRIPPAATESVNMIVLVDGQAYPMLFQFKRTGLKPYQRIIEPMENRYGHSVYELYTEDDKNSSAQAYKRLAARFVARSNSEQLALVNAIKAKITEVKAKAEKLVEAAEADDGDTGPHIPI